MRETVWADTNREREREGKREDRNENKYRTRKMVAAVVFLREEKDGW